MKITFLLLALTALIGLAEASGAVPLEEGSAKILKEDGEGDFYVFETCPEFDSSQSAVVNDIEFSMIPTSG